MDWHRVIDALHAGLETASAEVELEQAVSGLDAKKELALHPILHAALRAASFGVHVEQRFPSERAHRRRSQGARCDIVLTESGRPLEVPTTQQSLFALPDATPLRDAGWLEVKCVAQYHELGPNRAYAHALTHPVWKDVQKLARDEGIEHAAVLLILFTEDEAVAEHDLGVWSSRASLRGLPLWPRLTRAVPIGDRLGNRVCTVALFPIERIRT